MKLLGVLLTTLGLLVGVAVSLAIIGGVSIPGVSWLIAVGFAKLAYVASFGLIAAGAVFQRLARREQLRLAESELERRSIPGSTELPH